MDGKYGVENIKKVFQAIALLATLGDDVGRDTHAGRWTKLFGLIDIGTKIATIQFSQIKLELGDMSDVEKAEVLAVFGENLKLGDAALEVKIESGLAILVKLEAVIEESVAFAKSLKAA